MNQVRPVPPVSCRLEMLPGRRVGDRLEAARRLGFEGVALPGRYLADWLQPVKERLADSPLAMAGISLGFKSSLLNPEEPARALCRRSLLELFDVAAELQAGWINMPPCLTRDNPVQITEPNGFPTVRDRLDALLLEQLPDLGDAAHARGLRLLLEPVNRHESNYLNSIARAAGLCAQLNHPAIGVTADFFHLQLEELDSSKALQQAVTHVRHVHVAENTRVEPGSGSLDFRPGFAVLKEAGYAGWLEIECRTLSGPADEVLPKSAEYLRKTWNEV